MMNDKDFQALCEQGVRLYIAKSTAEEAYNHVKTQIAKEFEARGTKKTMNQPTPIGFIQFVPGGERLEIIPDAIKKIRSIFGSAFRRAVATEVSFSLTKEFDEVYAGLPGPQKRSLQSCIKMKKTSPQIRPKPAKITNTAKNHE